MTSAQNKKLPLLAPKPVIGTNRPPNRRDLRDRNALHGLPDPDPDVLVRAAALRTAQQGVRMRQMIAEMQPSAATRESLRVLADPEAEGEEEGEWETVADSADDEAEDAGERDAVDEFVAKVSGVEVRDVRAARRGPPGERGADVVVVLPPAAAATAAGPVSTAVMPRETVRAPTVAEAALALTNMRAGTRVTVEDLRTARLMVDLWDCEDTFLWTVGNVE